MKIYKVETSDIIAGVPSTTLLADVPSTTLLADVPSTTLLASVPSTTFLAGVPSTTLRHQRGPRWLSVAETTIYDESAEILNSIVELI